MFVLFVDWVDRQGQWHCLQESTTSGASWMVAVNWRTGLMAVTSVHATYVSALAGHAATHSGEPAHRWHLCDFVVAPRTGPSSAVICHGHAFTHVPQPTHLEVSITRALVGAITWIASCGHASWHGTGCLH